MSWRCWPLLLCSACVTGVGDPPGPVDGGAEAPIDGALARDAAGPADLGPSGPDAGFGEDAEARDGAVSDGGRADPCLGIDCSGHGTCDPVGPSCRCELGYRPVNLACVAEPSASVVPVELRPRPGLSGIQRVNFGLPLPPGLLTNPDLQVRVGGAEVPSARRGLSRWPDGSWRAVQVQAEVDVGVATLEVALGTASTLSPLSLVSVADTLVEETLGGIPVSVPTVWALLPAEWLSASTVFGRLSPESASQVAPGSAWARICDYGRWDTQAFLNAGAATAREVWLYDRATAFYRGYARRGDLETLQSAYREAGLYFSRITLAGRSASVDLPQSGGNDAKYVYTQNLAYHYLLSGDDRYREAAEGLATLADGLFDPEYHPGQHWTERHAGFTLLAAVFAAIVSDDRAPEFWSTAARRVDAYLAVQAGYSETPSHQAIGARCFAHDKVAADEDGDYPANLVCSPWMSAILADALDAYADEVGGAEATRVRSALVALGRRLAAADDVSAEGQPYYVLGVDGEGVPDDYHEHWGESAYVVALADLLSGRSDPLLASGARRWAEGFDQLGEVGQLRSFNWQCRSAVATPALLRP